MSTPQSPYPGDRRPIRVVRDRFADRPELDEAVSGSLLRRAAEGLEPETLRLRRPGSVVAFGSDDRSSAGLRDAVEAAHSIGFASVRRLVGGRAAVFVPEAIVFSWTVPDPAALKGITERFRTVSAIMTAALRDLGVDARVGEVAGEYCPGRYSVNAGGRIKLMGVGQLVVGGAAHVGGVVLVDGSDVVREVLVRVYGALGWSLDPRTVGSLRDEDSSISGADAEDAILGRFAERFRLHEESLDGDVVGRALELEAEHRI